MPSTLPMWNCPSSRVTTAISQWPSTTTMIDAIRRKSTYRSRVAGVDRAKSVAVACMTLFDAAEPQKVTSAAKIRGAAPLPHRAGAA